MDVQVVRVISVIGTAATDEEIAVASTRDHTPPLRVDGGSILSQHPGILVWAKLHIPGGKTDIPRQMVVSIAVLARIGARNGQVTHTGRRHCGERSEALMYLQ